jgi:two-component system, response regulator PdtaR
LKRRFLARGRSAPPIKHNGVIMPALPPTVLVVEDDFLVRLTAVAMIEDAGFLAVEAESADDAIELLEANPGIRLVFTDINMPGSMDGLKLAMYAHSRWPPLKFIIVSGKPIPGREEMPDGTHFHPKPYLAATIGSSLSALLACFH